MKAPIASEMSGSAISKTIRRRLRGNFLAGELVPSEDLAPSEIDGGSATTFKEGSAITLLVLCFVILWSLGGNRLPEVFPRQPELREQHADGGRIDAGQHRFGHRFDLGLDAIEQRPRRRGEVKPLGAAVGRVRPALDQAIVAK